MINYEDILAQIKSGKSEEDIANEFTTMLNKAIKVNAEEIQKQEKMEDAQRVADMFNQFSQKYYGDVAKGVVGAEDIVDIYDLLVGCLDNRFFETITTKAKPVFKKAVDATINSNTNTSANIEIDKVINDFLTKYGL